MFLVVGVHFLLRNIVLTPLNRAVHRWTGANGDLSTKVEVQSNNDRPPVLGRRSMQQGC
jgi:methyl-accepting chemotaxis protein